MKIQSVTVSHFGKLTDRTFRFTDGINLIYGENESGKSTLAAYLKYILYGFPTKGPRNAAGNDKLHYMPWSGGAASGKAELLLSDGTVLSVSRSSGAKNSLSVIEKNTGRERNFGKPLGEELFGTDEAAFSRMAYIREQNVSADRLEDLSESVQNIVLSADESVNIEKAQKKLRDFRNVYRGRTKGSGKCAELEERIRTLRHDFDRESEMHKLLLGAEAKLLETRKALERNDAKQKEAEKELENLDAFEAQKLLQTIRQSEAAFREAKKRCDNLRAELADGSLNAAVLDEISSAAERERSVKEHARQVEETLCAVRAELAEKEAENELLKKADGLTDLPENIQQNVGQYARTAKCRGAAAVASFVVSAAAAALYGTKIVSGVDLYLAVCGGAAALAFLLFTALFFAKRGKLADYLAQNGFADRRELSDFCAEYPRAKAALSELYTKEKILSEEAERQNDACAQASRDLRAVLDACGTATDDPHGFVDSVRKKLTAVSEAQTECEKLKSAYEAYLAGNDLDALAEKAKRFTAPPTRDRKTVKLELDFLKKAQSALLEKEKEYIRAAAAPSSTRRKPAEILAERTALEATLREAEQTADALELAVSALAEACEEMRCGVSPRIARRAGELFRLFTGNESEELLLTPEFVLSAERDGMAREDGMLSAGTSDAAYLAVRIALCENLFHEAPILILDETFAHMDDNRMMRTLRALRTVSEHFQIFLFSCREREIEAAEKIGAGITRL